jgi:hypothetical protein
VAGALLLATAVPANAGPTTSTPVNQPAAISGQHQIKNVAYNQCVVAPNNLENAGLQLGDCRKSGARAVWQFTPAGGIFFMSNKSSGFCAEVNDGTSIPGELVDQFTCNGSPAEQWVEAPTRRPADGLFYLELKHGELCLDTVGGAGSQLMQYTCDGNDAQLWIVN